MLAWWMLLPTLLAMMVALVLPGFMWLRAGGRSSLVAIGAAPAVTPVARRGHQFSMTSRHPARAHEKIGRAHV